MPKSFVMPANLWVIGLLVAVTCGGCGKKSPVPLVRTKGQVMYKGQPVAEATVMLVPQAGQKAAVGKTDAQGRFTLTTITPGDGAMPGKYKIIVTKAASVAPAAEAAELPNIKMEQVATLPSQREGLPAKYGNPNTTPLECEIPQSGSHDLGVLELKDE